MVLVFYRDTRPKLAAAGAAAGSAVVPAAGFSKAAALAFATKFVLPLLAVGAVIAAIYALSKNRDAIKGEIAAAANLAREQGLVTGPMEKYAQEQAKKEAFADARGIIPGFKSDEKAHAAGHGTFAQFLEATDSALADVHRSGKATTAQQSNLDKASAKYNELKTEAEGERKEIEDRILSSLVLKRRQDQLRSLDRMLQLMNLKPGAFVLQKSISPLDFRNNATAWIENQQNAGNPITPALLKQFGLAVFDPSKLEGLAPGGGASLKAADVENIQTLSGIGQVTGSITTRNRDLEALRTIEENARKQGSNGGGTTNNNTVVVPGGSPQASAPNPKSNVKIAMTSGVGNQAYDQQAYLGYGVA